MTQTLADELAAADRLTPLSGAKREFKNELGRDIMAAVEIGATREGYCRLSLYGPDSGIDSYTTWAELAMLYAVLAEAFGQAALRAKPAGEVVVVEEDDQQAWFLRNADRRRAGAFINTDPLYFASECADAIVQGHLHTRPAAEGVREALWMARSWLQHDAGCAMVTPGEGVFDEGPSPVCSCEYSARTAAIDAALADQPTSLQKTQTSADQPASDVAPERGRSVPWLNAPPFSEEDFPHA